MEKSEIALIDLENIGSMNNINIAEYGKIIIFCGAKQDKVSINHIPTEKLSEIQIFRVKETSKDNLDFHICHQLGRLDITEKKQVEFVVVSNDKGYDNLINSINKQGRACRRQEIHTEKKNKKDIKIQSVINSILSKEVKLLPKSEASLKNYIKSHLGEFNAQNNINYTYNRLIKNSTIANRLSSNGGEKLPVK